MKGRLILVAFFTVTGFATVDMTENARGDETDAATLKAVQTAWSARQTRVRTARVEWTARLSVLQSHLNLNASEDREVEDEDNPMKQESEARKKNLNDKSQPATPTNGYLEHELRQSFVVDGDQIRFETNGMVPYGPDALVPLERVAVTSGKINQICNNSRTTIRWPTGEIASGRKSHAFDVIDTLACRWALRPADSSVYQLKFDSREFRISEKRPIVDGRECLALVRRQKRFDYEYWLDPSMDYSIVRFITSYRNTPRAVFECAYARNDTSDVWAPTKWNSTRMKPDGSPYMITNGTVDKCELNIDVPARLFTIEFPSGTIVSDMREDAEGFDPGWKNSLFIVRPNGEKRFISWDERQLPYETLLRTRTHETIEDTAPRRSGHSVFFWVNLLGFAILLVGAIAKLAGRRMAR